MKIAFISTMAGVPWGGSEALWSETAKAALQNGHVVFTSTYYWEQKPLAMEALTGAGAQAYFRPRYTTALAPRLYNRIRNMVLKESAEVKALKRFDPDRILLNQSSGYDILHRPDLQQYLLSTAKPYFIICHNYSEELVLSERERALLLKIYSKAKYLFMICGVQAAAITKQLLCRLPNIKVVDNPVNLKEVAPIALPETARVQFASVASFHADRKGQDILFEVLSSEKWKSRDWQLNLYGTGPDKKYLEALVTYFGLDGRVVFKGHVEDINALWKINHLLLISSRIETGPMVLTEAMLCGRTVVTTSVGKVPEVVQDGCNGFVAEAPTASLYDKALERAWQQKTHWAAIGNKAYETAINKVDFNAAATFLQLLTEPLKA